MRSFFTFLLVFLIFSAVPAQQKPPSESVMDRFLRYVKIDTQSAEDAGKFPSTEKQLVLARLLESELKALGVQNVRISKEGIVYGMVPGNMPDNSKVPTIGFIAHMDTSPAVSGANVNPIIHKNYQGGDIVLPNDKTQVITVEQNPALKDLIGDDIITADGTTLLGSDDKAGIAEIMTMIDILRNNPQLKHGNIAIAFTPDEEVGGPMDLFDIEGWGAKYAYTVDGGELGEISDETWSARTATLTFHGKSTHPGYAKGIMINSAYAAADFLTRFPPDMLPETTEGRVGFVHPYIANLDVETSTVKVLIRDFDLSGVEAKENMLKQMAEAVRIKFPNVRVEYSSTLGYLNMKEVLKDHPKLVEYAKEATTRAGVKPKMKPIRGGTDGSRLTARGLPTPNLFTGGHNFHGKLEWNSRRGLEKSTEMLVNLVQIWAERSK
ncbi:peptidase T [Leptolyngbya sp. 7M]|uniref:peptidase T n=1 Tax=Leptolyngbya sp. 7M TaxID=2812896 RepID=UPI001B8C774B|nr:peptidase T [Leptolyngbya sp. 7M]QYO67224.1 peptidase T [Leptolyngbya sp. 7M]